MSALLPSNDTLRGTPAGTVDTDQHGSAHPVAEDALNAAITALRRAGHLDAADFLSWSASEYTIDHHTTHLCWKTSPDGSHLATFAAGMCERADRERPYRAHADLDATHTAAV